MNTSLTFWAIVPAAGIGKRMLSDIPKQYLKIGDETVLEIVLQKLNHLPQVKGIIVATAKADHYYENLKHIPINTVRIEGGKERYNSVLHALNYLIENGYSDDWAIVHDAARPCVDNKNMEGLISLVIKNGEGGLLASPVTDTLKQATGQRTKKTIDRTDLWQAHTPQIFPVKLLFKAITAALANGETITDEASAIESYGGHPLIYPDSHENIKITQPEDISLAEFILKKHNT